jgi:hypothetical protein
MDAATLAQARDNLAEREGCSVSAIGCWPTEGREFRHTDAIGEWSARNGIAGVVWAALPPRFDLTGSVPSADEIVSYLRGLSEPTKTLAWEYVSKTPSQIRRRIEPSSKEN